MSALAMPLLSPAKLGAEHPMRSRPATWRAAPQHFDGVERRVAGGGAVQD